MSKKRERNITFESSLAEGRNIGVEEVNQIYDLIGRHGWPADVRTFEVKFGKDSTDDPAVWIWYLVQDDHNPSAEKITKLNQFANSVRDDRFKANIKYWPYIDFRAVL